MDRGALGKMAHFKKCNSRWLEYVFYSPKVVRAYTLQTQTSLNLILFQLQENIRIVLDSQSNITNWVYSESKKFSFTNEKHTPI